MAYDGCSWNYSHWSLTWFFVQIIFLSQFVTTVYFWRLWLRPFFYRAKKFIYNLWNGENCELSPFQKQSLNCQLSAQLSHSVVSDSLWPHGLQHARLPCPSQAPGVYSNSCPLSRWCHPTISSSIVPYSSCPQSFPASGSFPMSQLFASGGQSIRVLASASVLPMNTRTDLL